MLTDGQLVAVCAIEALQWLAIAFLFLFKADK